MLILFHPIISQPFLPLLTAGKMMEYLEGISQGEEPKKEDGEVQLVTPEIIAQMPLKSFLSVIPGEAIEQMIVELNALCQ